MGLIHGTPFHQCFYDMRGIESCFLDTDPPPCLLSLGLSFFLTRFLSYLSTSLLRSKSLCGRTELSALAFVSDGISVT